MIRLLLRLSRLGFRLAILLALIWLAMPVIAQTRLDIPNARLLVMRLLESRQFHAAHDITSLLMTRADAQPGDRLLHARSLRGLGQTDTARNLARQVFNNANTDDLRYAAALVMAQSLSTAGHKTRAQIWLRRAAEIAPDNRRRAKAIRDFRYVRATNPWAVHARFGISPSNNVNRGPTDNTYIWNGLTFTNPSLVPLSGYEISSGLSLQYRKTLASQNRLSFGLMLDDSQFILSDTARRKDPTADGDAFAFRAVEARAALDWSADNSHWRHTAGLAFGRNWSGGSHLTDYMRGSWQGSRPLGKADQIGLRLSAERQWRQDAADRSADIWTIGGHWGRRFGNAAQLRLDLALSDMQAISAAVAHQKSNLTAVYSLGKPVLGALASFNIAYETRLYDRPLYSASPRHDDKFQLGATMFFTKFDLFGFAPKVGLTATRTNSNVSRFQTEALELSLGLQSVF